MQQKDLNIKGFLRIFLRHCAVAVASFFAGSATFNGFAPFGVAFAAGVPAEYIPAAVLGCTAGSFYAYSADVLALRYVASALIAGIASYIFKRNFKQKFHTYTSAFSCFFALLATGIAVSASITLTFAEVAIYSAEGLAGALIAFLFCVVCGIDFGKRNVLSFSAQETAAVLVTFCVMMLAFDAFSFYMILPGVTVGCYVVLVAATFGGEKYGAVFGITAGLMIGITQGNTFITGGVALGGLLGGILSKHNRIIAALVFGISVVAAAFSDGDWLTKVNLLYNVAVGVLLFVFMPKSISVYFKNAFLTNSDIAYTSGQKSVFVSRLFTAADGMNDVTERVKAVAGIYRRRTAANENDIYLKTAKKICSECPNADNCADNTAVFKNIVDMLKRKNSVEEDDLPPRFVDCVNKSKVISELSYGLECYRTSMREAAKTGETVNIVSDQFSSVAKLLQNFARSFGEADEFDVTKTNLVRNILHGSLGYEAFSCGVFKNVNDKLYCELSFKGVKRIDYKKTVKAVSEVLGLRFEEPAVTRLSDGTVNIIFCERTRYCVQSGGYQINSDGGKWCGDTYDSFFDGKGNFYMILSDGMGTGQKAAADSVMCCSLTSLLLRAGYPPDCILKMINSSMLVRSGEESLATLDVAVLNLYTGETDFYKAGAAATIAMRKLKMFKIEKPSLPVGILGQVKFETVDLQFGDGDAFVLMSDGVEENTVVKWREMLKRASEYDGRQLAVNLANAVKKADANTHNDDITVLTAVIKNNN